MRGFWKRPINRTYAYNLSLGEHYYAPMTSYLETERGSRGEGPGALTYSERLAHKWVSGRNYGSTDVRDKYARARSVARTDAVSALESKIAQEKRNQEEYSRMERHQQVKSSLETSRAVASMRAASEATRAASEMRTTSNAESLSLSSRSRQRQTQDSEYRFASSSNREIKDDICKRVADVRMMPFDATEIGEAQSASARARARIVELERELDEITRKAIMSTSKSLKTASQMAMQASYEEDMALQAASTKKSKKVIVESSSKIAA